MNPRDPVPFAARQDGEEGAASEAELLAAEGLARFLEREGRGEVQAPDLNPESLNVVALFESVERSGETPGDRDPLRGELVALAATAAGQGRWVSRTRPLPWLLGLAAAALLAAGTGLLLRFSGTLGPAPNPTPSGTLLDAREQAARAAVEALGRVAEPNLDERRPAEILAGITASRNAELRRQRFEDVLKTRGVSPGRAAGGRS